MSELHLQLAGGGARGEIHAPVGLAPAPFFSPFYALSEFFSPVCLIVTLTVASLTVPIALQVLFCLPTEAKTETKRCESFPRGSVTLLAEAPRQSRKGEKSVRIKPRGGALCCPYPPLSQLAGVAQGDATGGLV